MRLLRIQFQSAFWQRASTTKLRSSNSRAVLFLVLAAIFACGGISPARAQVTRTTEGPDRKEPQPNTGAAENAAVLKPGQEIEATVKDGGRHQYRFELKPGEYAKVTVKSRLSLLIELLDPDGKAIGDGYVGGGDASESLWMLANQTGNYQIRISSGETKEIACPYHLTLESVADLQTAPSSDQAYVKAFQLLWEGDQLLDKEQADGLHQAVEKYQKALVLWQALGSRLREAYTIHQLGFAYGRLGDIPNEVASYEKALRIWRSLGNEPENLADTLYNLGSIYAFHGQAAQAIAAYQEAIQLRRGIGDKSKGGLAYVLNNLGQVYVNIGEFQAALKCFEEAVKLRKELGDIAGTARSTSNLAAVYFRLGKFPDALDYSLQALPLRRAGGDRRGEAITLGNIGSTYRELGEPQAALGYYQQALSLLHRLEDHRGDDRYTEGILFDGIGRSYYDLGDYAKALDTYNQSLTLRKQPRDPYGEAATLANIGDVHARTGNREKALEYFEQSLQLQRSVGDRRGQTLTLQKAGEMYQESGDLKKAREYFDEGLALSRTIKNRSCEASLLFDIALNEKSSGHLAEARAQVEAAIAIIESARSAVASSALRASFLASKQDLYDLDIDLLMQSSSSDLDHRNVIRAFSVSEQKRARSLLDSLESGRANINGGASSELLTRERELRARLNDKAERQIKLLSGDHTPEQAASLADEVERISRDYEQLLAEIKVSDPHYAVLTQSNPVSLKELQTEILDPDTLLLEYALGKERSYLWSITSTDIAAYELPARAEIENQTRHVYDLLTARGRFVKFEKPDERRARIANSDAEYLQSARQLSQLLLGPVAGKLKGKRILIVSDGALQYLPFAALPSPAEDPAKDTETSYRPLIIDHEITGIPSASILTALRREVRARKPAPGAVAVLADPVFSKTDERVTGAQSVQKAHNDPAARPGTSEQGPENQLVRAIRDLDADNELEIDRLPSTRREAEAILALIPKADQFSALDFDANRSAATSPRLGQYRIVHFATHGLLNSSHPGLSGLILSLVDRDGNDQNGFLTTNEIFNLKLPADLVVLSGCRTGLGKEIKGEGMLGLTRGFLYAGAARLAVSLWDVDDESSSALMAHFYSGMLGKKHLSPAAALKDAQLTVMKSSRWHAPYYWAAFVLEGEYR